MLAAAADAAALLVCQKGRSLGGSTSSRQKVTKPERVIRTEEDVFAQAAMMILEADHLLIAAGAGFSADSGLPVYKVCLV